MSLLKVINYILIWEFVYMLSCITAQEFLTECDSFYNKSCFTYTKSPYKQWSDARSNCTSRGGYLTSINSVNENNMLASLVLSAANGSTGSNAWIGLDYNRYIQLTKWVDGNPITYSRSPDTSGTYQLCIVITGGGNWRAFSCSSTRSYICRISGGSSFAVKRDNGQYESIDGYNTTIDSIPTTLVCRTDTYQSTRITWEYKSIQNEQWTDIQGSWNETTGISEFTVTNYGYYRCHVKSGGSDQIYTATAIDLITAQTTTVSSTSSDTITTNSDTTTTNSDTITTNSDTITTNSDITTTNSDTITTNPDNRTTFPTTITIATNSTTTTNTGNLSTYIAIGTIAGVLVVMACITTVLITILIIIYIKQRKPKEYQYLSKVKYSNRPPIEIPPVKVRKSKNKDDKLNYENLLELTAGIDITESELMDTLEDPGIQIPESIYSTTYATITKTTAISKVYYEDVTQLMDPRMEPINLDHYKQHLTKLMTNVGTLEDEYKSLGGVAMKYPCENALLEHNKRKNKYKTLYPYDKSRVELSAINGDTTTTYINASYIPGVYSTQNFIAAQGPKEGTINDFWRMIVENDVTNIVMLTNIIEGNRKKCEMYFPLDGRHPEQFGDCIIQQVNAETFLGYIVRVFKVTFGNKSMQVKHFHFTAWPDHDVPTVFDELLSYVHRIHKELMYSKSRILVHCSAGVGRTGTFIALFNILSAIEKSLPMSIYRIVHEMREHRPQMVQTFRQYKFIYLSVSELLFEDTSIEVANFAATYKQYIETDLEGYESILYQQYNELNFQTDKTIELPYDTGNDPKNAKKNPVTTVVPYDENRVVLMLFSDNDSDYINASYMMNLNFIATIHPNPHTLSDFIQMVTQTAATLVIMLTTRKEKSEIEGKTSKRIPYWGKTDETIRIPPFTVKNTHSEKSTTMIKQSLVIEDSTNGLSHSFKQLISVAWNDKGEPTDMGNIIVLLQIMVKYRQENPHIPIIVHCTDGIGRTGVLLSIFKVMEQINKKEPIDIFHVIKSFRSERMNFVPSLTHFLSCFALTNEYCTTII